MAITVPPLDKNDKCAVIYSNGDKILFEPLFGYRQYVPLPNSKRKIFNLSEITTAELGKNAKEMFENSVTLDISEIDDFFVDDRIEREDKECLNIMIKLFNKKNKADLYKNLMQIPTGISKGIVDFRPTKHQRSDYYCDVASHDKAVVYIPLSSSDEEIGEALKLALTRCTGLGAYEFHKKLKALGWEE
jgi:hypothetical protein